MFLRFYSNDDFSSSDIYISDKSIRIHEEITEDTKRHVWIEYDFYDTMLIFLFL